MVGISSPAQVDQNVKAMETSPDPELLAELLRMIEPVANIYWQEGRPENHDPGAIEQKSSVV